MLMKKLQPAKEVTEAKIRITFTCYRNANEEAPVSVY